MYKQFYYCITATQRWGRGTDRESAMKAAGLNKTSKTEYLIYIGIVNDEATDEEVRSVCWSFGVNGWGSIVVCDDLSKEKKAQVKKLFVGWLKEHFNIPKEALKKQNI